ncbi:16S rRNA (guanine(527)-N(7))-methyltransferase RsmG [Sphingorhabdus arenilitoris]|uniref:Ribosomal RNA small subunit methyltransferase G n=1 Tax=Sphingorhabdus arenilitoris TaxID=1490041 RepID=A0ABV8RD09_9SPHN
MTEDEAKAWLISQLNVSRETMEKLECFIAFLRAEAENQNLIAASTLDSIWARHIVDSAQLLIHLPADMQKHQRWLDLGSGAGFPGIVIALLTNHQITLVESRARRIDYLERAALLLDFGTQVQIAGSPVEKLQSQKYDVISARAFAPLPRLLSGAARFSTEKSYWLLPKGRNAVKEMEDVTGQWPIDFRVVPSITDADAGILIGRLRGVLPKKAKK